MALGYSECCISLSLLQPFFQRREQVSPSPLLVAVRKVTGPTVPSKAAVLFFVMHRDPGMSAVGPVAKTTPRPSSPASPPAPCFQTAAGEMALRRHQPVVTGMLDRPPVFTYRRAITLNHKPPRLNRNRWQPTRVIFTRISAFRSSPGCNVLNGQLPRRNRTAESLFRRPGSFQAKWSRIA